jgi:ATP-dependent RNA helicase SUPV3L1/SUV3
LVETFGILPREQVTEEVKSLSQEDRAKLRQFGVRFGAFNVYVPLLLKPAAAELRLLLWGLGLERDGRIDLAGLPEGPGQGLTSAAFDRSTPRGFYGVCGYRICGNRVVRIDMLERLADIIRERVFWRPRFPEDKRPSGSVEGGGFTIVPDMMSLVGCSGEDFQAILRSLDFRMQRKKVKPASPEPVIAAPDTPPEVAAAAIVPDSFEAPEATVAEAAEPVAEEQLQAAAEIVESFEATAAPEAEAPVAEAAEPAAEDQPLVAVETASQATGEEPPADSAAPAEPAEIEIEVWWPKDTGPFRHFQEKKHNKPQRHRRRPPAPAAQPAVEGEAAQPVETAKPGRPSHKHNKHKRPPKTPPDRPQRKPERPVDPDSPFAVLGALKAQFARKSN